MSSFFNTLRNTVANIFIFMTFILIILDIFIKEQIFNNYFLFNLLLFSLIMGLLFNWLFNSKYSETRSFIKRMSLFIVMTVLTSLIFIVTSGLFQYIEHFMWLIFVVIVLTLYLVNMLIYISYSRKKERQYTKKLQNFQKQNL